MKLFLFTVSILLLLISIEAFFPQSASSGIARRALFRQFSEVSTEPTTETSSLSSGDGNGDNKSASTGVWPGNRPPMMNEKLKLQRMSATWGRGRFRTEVWDDDVNPINNWWEAYAPSQEQLEAMAAGYDFSDSKSYFEEKGIDYEAASAETQALLDKKVEALKKELEESDASLTTEDFKKLVDDMFHLQTLAYEKAFRLIDDEKQAAKGQPSLDNDDTGDQWANDA